MQIIRDVQRLKAMFPFPVEVDARLQTGTTVVSSDKLATHDDVYQQKIKQYYGKRLLALCCRFVKQQYLIEIKTK